MAAVGLSWNDCKMKCPSDIFPACHNSADSVTVSGPVESIASFVQQLKSQNIFAKVVNSNGFAFHSKYIASAGEKLRLVLEKIIPCPKKRSSRWISSSISSENQHTSLAEFSSPAYHVNNLLSPVLFAETLSHIPHNSIAIEISPHCLMTAILRRSLPSTVTKLNLQNENYKDNLEYFFLNIGKMYNAGAQPKIEHLYPSINYPVSRGTPMINSFIEWDHSTNWKVAKFNKKSNRSGQTIIEVNLSKLNDAHIAGHVIGGRIMYPASGYLVSVWKVFANMCNKDFQQMPVVMENVIIHEATIIPKNGSVKFSVSILNATGKFVICDGDNVKVTGQIRASANIEMETIKISNPIVSDELVFNSADVYKEFSFFGLEYSGDYKGILKSDYSPTVGKLKWIGNWISFIDTIFQFHGFGNKSRILTVPTGMKKIVLNPELHKTMTKNIVIDDGIDVYYYPTLKVIKSGGIEMKGIKTSFAPKNQQIRNEPKYERYTFVPYKNIKPLDNDPEIAKCHALTVLLQIALENLEDGLIRGAEVVNQRSVKELLSPIVVDILMSEPRVSVSNL